MVKTKIHGLVLDMANRDHFRFHRPDRSSGLSRRPWLSRFGAPVTGSPPVCALRPCRPSPCSAGVSRQLRPFGIGSNPWRSIPHSLRWRFSPHEPGIPPHREAGIRRSDLSACLSLPAMVTRSGIVTIIPDSCQEKTNECGLGDDGPEWMKIGKFRFIIQISLPCFLLT